MLQVSTLEPTVIFEDIYCPTAGTVPRLKLVLYVGYLLICQGSSD